MALYIPYAGDDSEQPPSTEPTVSSAGPTASALPPRMASDEMPYEAPSFSDHLTNLEASIHAAKSDYYAAQAQNETDPKQQKYYNDLSKYHTDQGQGLLDDLSPAAKQNSQAGFLSGDWRAHPFSATALALEQQIPTLGVA